MTRYTIDPERSVAWIEVRSSLHPVHSETRGLEGFFEVVLLDDPRLDDPRLDDPRVDRSAPPAGHVELSVDRLSSGNPLYDREMRRRVDAGRFPVIAGDLVAMTETGESGQYRVHGDVTFRGVTGRYEDDMVLTTPSPGVVCLEGTHVFDVRDFGMDPPRILMLKVHPEVTVRVRIVAEHAP